MFNNPRYITRGVAGTIPLWLQNIILYMIETMEVSQQDYLQVFELSIVGGKQHITHTQEEPPYTYNFEFEAESPVTAKVFVIDDKTHTTILLASEY